MLRLNKSASASSVFSMLNLLTSTLLKPSVIVFSPTQLAENMKRFRTSRTNISLPANKEEKVCV